MPKRGPRAPLCNEVASVILESDVPLKMSALAVALGIVVPGDQVPTNISSILRLRLKQLLSAGKISYTGERACRVYHAPTASAKAKAQIAARVKAQAAARSAAAKLKVKYAALVLATVRAKAKDAALAKAVAKSDKYLARAKAKCVVKAAAEAKAKDDARNLAEASAKAAAKAKTAAEFERASVRATSLRASLRNRKRRSPVARATHPAVRVVLDAHPWRTYPGLSADERDALALFDCLIG